VAVHVLGWLLPFHKDGVSLPVGIPGWQAFRFAFSSVWPYQIFVGDVTMETWYAALLATLSALTNTLILLAVWVALRPSGRRLRLLSWLAMAGFVVDAQWLLFFGPERKDLRIGYFLWWLSFLLLAIGATTAKGQSDQKDEVQNPGAA